MIGSESAGIGIGTHMGYQCYRQKLSLLCHSACSVILYFTEGSNIRLFCQANTVEHVNHKVICTHSIVHLHLNSPYYNKKSCRLQTISCVLLALGTSPKLPSKFDKEVLCFPRPLSAASQVGRSRWRTCSRSVWSSSSRWMHQGEQVPAGLVSSAHHLHK